jgi:hypothetical protein
LFSLVVLVALCLAFLAQAPAAQAATWTLVRTIDTSAWNPPSPDPSGITYWPQADSLVVSDGEVDEMPIFRNANVFKANRSTGALQDTYDVTPYTKEAVGIDIDIVVDPVTGRQRLFISDDSKKMIHEFSISEQADPSIVRSFSTTPFGNNDPEGMSLGTVGGQLYLFTVDGAGREVYITNPGSGGIFGDGNDSTTHFDVGGMGIRDPEGIDISSGGTLFIVDRGGDKVIEVTTGGALIQTVNLRTFVPAVDNPGDLTFAPSSTGSGQSLYIVDRGVDNNTNPKENDGRIYEIQVGAAPPPGSNLLQNASFEIDVDANNRPDSWTAGNKFTRSDGEGVAPPVSGSYVGRFFATDNSGLTARQVVGGVTGGGTYTLSSKVNIPATADAFTFRFRIQWRNASNGTIGSPVTVATLTAATAGWVLASGSATAPAGAASAEVMLTAGSLNGRIYVDDISFR